MGRVANAYREWCASGRIEPDGAQQRIVEELDRVAQAIDNWQARSAGVFSKLGLQKKPEKPKGLYIHGGVGRGKTMLMDLFFHHVEAPSKRRLHFHEFMAEVHERIARGRSTTDGDPIPFVASEMAAEAPLLCFDEFQVTDIADAMILGRLFKVLFDRGVIVVATSNSAPDELYRDGLNRGLFIPFISLLKSEVDVVELRSDHDYRLDRLAGHDLYLTPLGAEATQALDGHWRRLTGKSEGKPIGLMVKGRLVPVPESSAGVARFCFDDLCAKPLGSQDYLHIAQAFHTILLDGVPVLNRDKRNEARRFINLIDTLYDQRVCLIVAADAEPDALYVDGDGARAFERAASRLMEMRSADYLSNLSRNPVSAGAS